MFTHFATADEADDSFVDRQYQHMLEAEAICGAQGVHPMIHVSNSAAITRYPDYRRDMVRLGISLYGCPPSDLLAGAADLWPVMSLKSAIVRLREAAPGEAVGYGCTYRVKRPTLVATRINTVLSWPSFSMESRMRPGSTHRAMSLKARVGPCNSSKPKRPSPMDTKGAVSEWEKAA